MPEAIREQLPDLPLVEVAAEIRRRALSPVEATRATLDRVAALDGKLNAFVTVLADQALAAASTAEAEIASGQYRGPLHGVPLSVKDLFFTAGIRTTASSRILTDHVPDEDAPVIQRLREAGAILIGKTNMLEFAYAAVHPDFGPTPNPWNLTRSTSGSSSGSAAAVAAGMGYGSVGSDTGGSIRLPAAYCRDRAVGDARRDHRGSVAAATVRGGASPARHPHARSDGLPPPVAARAPRRLQPGRAGATGARCDHAGGQLHPGTAAAAADHR
jgi:hypothetical protein